MTQALKLQDKLLQKSSRKAILQTFIEKKSIHTKPVFLEGGHTIDIGQPSSSITQSIKPITESMKHSIENHKLDKYDFEMTDQNIEITQLDKIFQFAKKNWHDVIEEKEIHISQNITFCVYKSISFDELGDIQEIEIEKEFFLNKVAQNNSFKVYIHKNAFYKCLTRQKMIWNGTLGSLCLFKRDPDIFYPNTSFSMNYLVLNKEQLAEIAD